MTALKDSLSNLIRVVGDIHRRHKLAQLERDFRTIVERTQRERTASTVTEIAQQLKTTLDDVEQRIRVRPADRSVILYDLSRANRAARDVNNQITFTAVTLAIISERARELQLTLDDGEMRDDSVALQLQKFIDYPVANENG